VNDYYDRLEQQLMEATARPWPRTLRGPSARWGPRRDLLALAAGLAVAAGVAAIFIGVRPAARPATQLRPQQRLAIVHNYVNRAPPPLGGAFSCETRLAPARVDPSRAPIPWNCYVTGVSERAAPLRGPGARGTVVVNLKPPSGDVFSMDASALPPSASGGDYAVWLLSGRDHGVEGCTASGCPAVHYSLISGRRPTFVGIVTPAVGANGRLRAQGLIPTLSAQQATGSYLFVVSRQGRPSNQSVGRIVLEGWMSF
jgi:hypothetical protein